VVAPDTLYIGHGADAAVVVFKTWFIQSGLFLFGFHKYFFLSLYKWGFYKLNSKSDRGDFNLPFHTT
jgi:hypothetical protein